MDSGDWVTKLKQVEKFAKDNDGECIVAEVKFFDDGDYATCVFRNADELENETCKNWDYYFIDEPIDLSKYDIDMKSPDVPKGSGDE